LSFRDCFLELAATAKNQSRVVGNGSTGFGDYLHDYRKIEPVPMNGNRPGSLFVSPECGCKGFGDTNFVKLLSAWPSVRRFFRFTAAHSTVFGHDLCMYRVIWIVKSFIN
jgi:hypothetical protein